MTTDERAGPLTATGSLQPGRRTRLRLLLMAGSALVAGVVLLPDAVDLDRVLPFAVFVALRLPLAVATWVVAVGLLVVRRGWWPVLVPALAVAVVATAVTLPRAIADPPPPPGGTDLTILELNSFEGSADVATLAGLVRSQRPDLVVLPEAGERFRERIAPLVPGYRSWTNVPPTARDVRGIVVLASPRAGAVRATRLDLDTRYPWAELTGGILGPTRLVGVHLVSVVPDWISYWPDELGLLARWCTGPQPALVVGDFNASLDHSAFRDGIAGCDDAASQTGHALVSTWFSGVPRALGTQIDHTLERAPHGDGPQARAFRVIDVPGSDHRATLVTVRLP